MLARVGPGRLALSERHRFANQPVLLGGTLHWDVLGLYRGVLDGLRAVTSAGVVPGSVGVDSWAVDYGLIDAAGTLVGLPVHYRDDRTEGVVDEVAGQVPLPELYALTGVRPLRINTLFQLVAEADSARLAAAARLLLIPDLIGYWLTGVAGAESTNASTTQLLDIHSGQWSDELIGKLGLRRELFGVLRTPGQQLGPVRPEVAADTGLPAGTPVTAVGSHDTASAVAAVPAATERFGYISCGTWSLVGVELSEPVLSEDARLAGFTNESGVDGTVRFLRNVMGLWLAQECLRQWRADGLGAGLPELLRAAARLPPGAVVDADDEEFLAPGDMPARIAAWCARAGEPVPEGPAAVVRCIMDSLARAHARAVADAQRLSGHAVDVVHLVGGGARNELLCQLTADACGVPVVAGPVEAAAMGNALVQARALGVVPGELADLRALVRATQPLRTYQPR
ncbi:rhamnulokinase [Amycolatopsis suaedae]|uniref:Rhamnulokinase n=2 Tax=Amycolatopsis suaedae TaxID=2510978 RepID=A0A4Q7IZH5_9PSEU|nr:rhamnulokinase [Amycolatopsis suaedae]